MKKKRNEYPILNLSIVKDAPIISSEEALADVERIEWASDVLDGRRKVTVSFPKEVRRGM